MIASLVSFVTRLVLAAATVVLVLGLMAVALFTMLVLIAWSLIRGRRPKIDVSGFARARGRFAPGRPGARPVGEVVDVEAREVPEATPAPAPRLDR
ncbi:hypothetical protein [Roseateles violae]|uniref:Uncharacterized protein n=1 Tax=Roseateles violae TaxID=3058042 RepID=A0ABT8DUV0_9BURK|nr:hypothetical protein [Pelomonas sp. PFR6]MDN3920147.1 hypothetical protein [Pelomonas sp. PFR6]